MSFVKVDCGILDSSLWIERDARSLFLTALFMADPYVLDEPEPAISVQSLEPSGFVVPAGRYGFVKASGSGIIRRDGIAMEKGWLALEALCSPDPESRSEEFEGRRMARVNGGYVVLNYARYRDFDHTAAERSKRYRDSQKELETAVVVAQGGGCACCGKPLEKPYSKYVVRDHDHVTGILRGVVCQSCNRLIGGVERNQPGQAIEAAKPMVTAYLSRYVTRDARDDDGDGRNASTSPSPSVESIPEQKPVQQQKDSIQGERPGVAKLAAFMAAHDFGKLASIVEGFLRSQRNSIAVIATMEMHLAGEMGHERATPPQLALAIQQYAASAEPTFKAMLFAGFIRKAKAQPERTARRSANVNEEAQIAQEKRDAELRQQEERDRDMLAGFERRNEAKYEQLKDQAAAIVAKNAKGRRMTALERDVLIHDELVKLVRKEIG